MTQPSLKADMNTQRVAPKIDFSQLLRATEGLTQWRPLALGFLTLVGCGLLVVAGMFLATSLNGALGGILAFVVGVLALIAMASGFSGVGVMLMDQAKSIAPRSMMDALLFGLMCLPKFLGFACVLLGLTLALALVAALVYFLCKIPGVGPLLLFVAHPVMVVVAGVFFTAISWVAIPLFTPAVWDGRGFKESLSLVFAVARTRLVQVVGLFLGLYVVVSIVALLLTAALLPGYGFMTGLASAIIGSNMMGDMSSLMYMGSGHGSGHLYAGMLATGLIFAVATTLMFQVLIMGVNLVYLSATDGVDILASQEALNAGLAQAKNKAREAQERAREAAEHALQSTQNAASAARASIASATATPAPAAPAQPGCPQCHQSIAEDDVFCGHCGHKLH